MTDGLPPFLDIVFFAMVAAFLVLRLRAVLGRRTGNEQQRPNPYVKPTPGEAESPADDVTRLPERPAPGETAPAAPPRSALEAGIAQLKIADPSFDPRVFLGGAKAAFEVILNSFAAGDTSTLRPLLADDVYERFAAAIRERHAAGQVLETTLVGVKNAAIVEAAMNGRDAVVSVKLETEQINVTRDAEGRTVDGDATQVATITDIWTFSRNTRTRDPNWLLVATAAQQ